MNTELIQTDKEVYDMAEHLKQVYDKKELEVSKLKEENTYLKKIILSCYGSLVLLDQQYENVLFDEQCNQYIIASLKGYLEDIVEHEVLKLEHD